MNRLGLDEALDATNGIFTLFYLDLDGFKPINDNFGHLAGDKMLSAVAQRLRSIVGADDIVSRLGGDEFVILAPNMSPSSAEIFAERIVRGITDEPYTVDAVGRLRAGVSVGFVCMPEDADSDDDLLQKCDAALYKAKAAGKGTYRRYGVAEQPPPAGRVRQRA